MSQWAVILAKMGKRVFGIFATPEGSLSTDMWSYLKDNGTLTEEVRKEMDQWIPLSHQYFQPDFPLVPRKGDVLLDRSNNNIGLVGTVVHLESGRYLGLDLPL